MTAWRASRQGNSCEGCLSHFDRDMPKWENIFLEEIQFLDQLHMNDVVFLMMGLVIDHVMFDYEKR
jgi:hypothetical protein